MGYDDFTPVNGRGSVLAVDDTVSNLDLIESVLKKDRLKVIKVSSPVEAIDIFEAQHPDIAVVDVMMPEIDGFRLCQILKERTGGNYFPVVLLTALHDQASKLKGIESGADDFISKPFDPKELSAKIRSLLKIKFLYDELEHSENIILTLAVALEARDPYTRGHSTRVGNLSREFAGYLGLSTYEQDMLRKAGLLHDIGKIGLSESILLKPTPLSDDEMKIIKGHPITGEQICKPLHSLREILPAIRHHHERWDGLGFPDGLKEKDIPLFARILSIVDTFDAMLSERPYRDGKAYPVVLYTMEKEMAHGQWDPELLRYFLEMIKGRGEESFFKLHFVCDPEN